jgi:hypothetical protein
MLKSIFNVSRIRNFESLLDPKRIVSDHNIDSPRTSAIGYHAQRSQKSSKDFSCGLTGFKQRRIFIFLFSMQTQEHDELLIT